MAGVLLSEDAARRVTAAARWVEANSGSHVGGSGWYPPVADDSAAGLKLCKTTSKWLKDSSADLDEYSGKPGAEAPATGANVEKVTAYNLFGDVESGKWVVVGQVGENWYLLAVEPTEVEVLTEVKLEAGGLTFKRKKVMVYHEASSSLADTVIGTTACP